MSDLLHRVELHTPDQAHEVMRLNFLPWVGQQLKQGRELVIEARLLDDDITDKQRAYLHAVVLTEIAQQARPNGHRYSMETWKEMFRAEYLGFKVLTYINPVTGKKHRRRVRISTENLGVRAMAEYIERIVAYAATDLGITVSEPLPPELRASSKREQAVRAGRVDSDTGEIQQTDAATALAAQP